jgi:hypothetical protein
LRVTRSERFKVVCVFEDEYEDEHEDENFRLPIVLVLLLVLVLGCVQLCLSYRNDGLLRPLTSVGPASVPAGNGSRSL